MLRFCTTFYIAAVYLLDYHQSWITFNAVRALLAKYIPSILCFCLSEIDICVCTSFYWLFKKRLDGDREFPLSSIPLHGKWKYKVKRLINFIDQHFSALFLFDHCVFIKVEKWKSGISHPIHCRRVFILLEEEVKNFSFSYPKHFPSATPSHPLLLDIVFLSTLLY